jgi:hypothetical protein
VLMQRCWSPGHIAAPTLLYSMGLAFGLLYTHTHVIYQKLFITPLYIALPTQEKSLLQELLFLISFFLRCFKRLWKMCVCSRWNEVWTICISHGSI